ncbi:MAG: hypothetical protein HOQ05_02580 [Corynebacteriales bacterium]|nr:hypothetical protein [Mycobacteriales bacterium]
MPGQNSEERGAQIRAAIAELPSPSWLASYTEGARSLGQAVGSVLAGSSRPQPAAVVRDTSELDKLLTTAQQQIMAAIQHIGQYAAREGYAGADSNGANWHGATPESVGGSPEATLASIAKFVGSAQKSLQPQPLQQGARQIASGRSRLSGIAGPMAPAEISNAVGALGQAQKALEDSASRVASINRELGDYLTAALGAPGATPTGTKAPAGADNTRG